MLRPVIGLKISRAWLGYGNVLFLELGRLHTEHHKIQRRRSSESKKGQATIMIHSEWRTEASSHFAFGSGSDRKILTQRMNTLKGRRLMKLATEGGLPELLIVLDKGIVIRSFSTFRSPDWTIFLRDQGLFPREKRWRGVDHTLSVGVSETGGFVRSVCY